MSIVVENLTKTFGSHFAVKDVSFEVPKNKLFCVVGPSGCGKSTLLRLIAGLEVPDSGRIVLAGETVADPARFTPPEARSVGVVFQSYALWPHMTVAQNVAFPYEAQGFSKADANRRAGQNLETVALSEYAARRPDALSGGQRQRVALARCLAGDARTILMDEPLANLDPHLRAEMETELRAFHDRSGVTTLFITHDQREAMALADVMAVMDQGRILQIGTAQEIYARPSNATVARFIGRGTLVETIVNEGAATLCGQSVSLTGAMDGPRTVFIRPADIRVGDTGWPCRVASIQYRGSHWEAQVEGEGLATEVRIDLAQPAQIGARLCLAFTGGWVLPD